MNQRRQLVSHQQYKPLKPLPRRMLPSLYREQHRMHISHFTLQSSREMSIKHTHTQIKWTSIVTFTHHIIGHFNIVAFLHFSRRTRTCGSDLNGAKLSFVSKGEGTGITKKGDQLSSLVLLYYSCNDFFKKQISYGLFAKRIGVSNEEKQNGHTVAATDVFTPNEHIGYGSLPSPLCQSRLNFTSITFKNQNMQGFQEFVVC